MRVARHEASTWQAAAEAVARFAMHREIAVIRGPLQRLLSYVLQQHRLRDVVLQNDRVTRGETDRNGELEWRRA
jgi:hypothetical protein